MIVSSINVRAMIQQQFQEDREDVFVAFICRKMKRGILFRVSRIDVGPMIKEQEYKKHFELLTKRPVFQGNMQRTVLIVVSGVDVDVTVKQQQIDNSKSFFYVIVGNASSVDGRMQQPNFFLQKSLGSTR